MPRVTVTVDATPPPAAAISAGDEPLDRMASSAQRLPAYDRVGVGVDQPGRDQAAAQVLHVVHVDDVVDHAGMRWGSSAAGPAQAIRSSLHDDGGVAQDLRASPQATDIGQQPNSHRRSPPGLVIPCAMSVHRAMTRTRQEAPRLSIDLRCDRALAPVPIMVLAEPDTAA